MITNYSELQSAVADFLARIDVNDRIPTFISLFEAQFNRSVRVRDMETIATLTAGATAAVPDDFLEFRRLTASNDTYYELRYVTPSALKSIYPNVQSGYGSLFTIEAGNILFAPIPTGTVELLYYKKLPGLAASVTGTNWLLDKHPDIYLAGTMVAAYVFLKDKDNAAFWKNIADEAITNLDALDINQGGPSSMTPLDVYTP